MRSKNSKYAGGFTLIEIGIVAVITVTMATVSFLSISRYARKHSLKNAVNEIVAVVRDAQQRSITQENGTNWGVRFINAVTNPRYRYQLISCEVCGSPNIVKTYGLRNGIEFSDPASGVTKDIFFAAVSGKPSSTQQVVLYASFDPLEIHTIIMEQIGVVRISTGMAYVTPSYLTPPYGYPTPYGTPYN
ncbi:hypothetical protein HY967_01370 [Candidatus Jorgensenbacteria bacterium]|nr:hypothetical protein [Candidatus Jorgensenbacteria bacterium]